MLKSTELLKIINGDNKSLVAQITRWVLWLLTPIYRLAIVCRSLLFRLGVRKSVHAQLPVISVGNLTTGGTGKTPFVIWLAGHLRQQGKRVAILSRGYGSDEDGLNDEARELALRLPDVPNLINRDRCQSATIALEELEMEAVLLDDGFQHRQLKRDLDLVLIDATCPFGFGFVLPRGLMREPPKALRRADAIIVSRADGVPPNELKMLVEKIGRLAPEVPLASVRFAPQRWVQADGKFVMAEALAGKRILSVCGIGNPMGFRQTLARLGCQVVSCQEYSDHHLYTAEDVASIIKMSDECRAEVVVCTMKDLVKFNRNLLGDVPLYALEIATVFDSGQELIESMVGRVISRFEFRNDGYR
ncbi:MAG: tetraacyldisaccharide 4'-kinase [Pirellulaceae bacterium]